MRDIITIRGELYLRVYNSKNETLWTYDTPNIITYGAQDVIRDLLAQTNSPGGRPPANETWLETLRVGTNNTSPARGNTGLGSPVPNDIYAVTFTSVVNDVGGQLIFEANIPVSWDPSVTIVEAGLFTKGTAGSITVPATNGEILFARQIHPGILKTSGIGIQYVWTLTFS